MAYTTIDNPELYFQTKLYAGNSSTQAITLDGSEDMQPDFVWIKNRNDGSNQSHILYDSVRGTTKFLQSNSTASEATDSNGLTAFGTDGFTLGNSAEENAGFNHVAWCWKESTTAGFDIISYTGNGTAGRTVAHNLSAVPELIIITYLNSTTPSSSVITLGGGNDENKNSDNHIIYAFKNVQGFSKVNGKYTGNGDANGAFIYTGFTPELLWIKRSSGLANWVFKTKSTPTFGSAGYNPNNKYIYGNLSNAEALGSKIDFLSNGFKWRIDGANQNSSGDTFAFVAFAKAPFVNSKGVPNNAE